MNRVFHYNYFNFLVPVIFLLAAWIIASELPELHILLKILLGIGIVSTILVLIGYRTVIITHNQLGIKKLWRSKVIDVEDIIYKNEESIFHRGAESITWKLILRSGETITISSDSIRDAIQFKEVFNWFLRRVPKTEPLLYNESDG